MRLLATKSSIKLSSECLAEQTDDKRRKEAIKKLCENTWLFGVTKMLMIQQFFAAQKVVERACRADIEMQGKMVVKELIDSTDLYKFLRGIERSNLIKGNNIVIDWLCSSYNMQKKLRIIFHGMKYKLGQFEKNARVETEEDNKFTAFKTYLDLLVVAVQIGFYPFEDGEKELEYALSMGEMVIHDNHFTLML